MEMDPPTTEKSAMYVHFPQSAVRPRESSDGEETRKKPGVRISPIPTIVLDIPWQSMGVLEAGKVVRTIELEIVATELTGTEKVLQQKTTVYAQTSDNQKEVDLKLKKEQYPEKPNPDPDPEPVISTPLATQKGRKLVLVLAGNDLIEWSTDKKHDRRNSIASTYHMGKIKADGEAYTTNKLATDTHWHDRLWHERGKPGDFISTKIAKQEDKGKSASGTKKTRHFLDERGASLPHTDYAVHYGAMTRIPTEPKLQKPIAASKYEDTKLAWSTMRWAFPISYSTNPVTQSTLVDHPVNFHYVYKSNSATGRVHSLHFITIAQYILNKSLAGDVYGMGRVGGSSMYIRLLEYSTVAVGNIFYRDFKVNLTLNYTDGTFTKHSLNADFKTFGDSCDVVDASVAEFNFTLTKTEVQGVKVADLPLHLENELFRNADFNGITPMYGSPTASMKQIAFFRALFRILDPKSHPDHPILKKTPIEVGTSFVDMFLKIDREEERKQILGLFPVIEEQGKRKPDSTKNAVDSPPFNEVGSDDQAPGFDDNQEHGMNSGDDNDRPPEVHGSEADSPALSGPVSPDTPTGTAQADPNPSPEPDSSPEAPAGAPPIPSSPTPTGTAQYSLDDFLDPLNRDHGPWPLTQTPGPFDYYGGWSGSPETPQKTDLKRPRPLQDGSQEPSMKKPKRNSDALLDLPPHSVDWLTDLGTVAPYDKFFFNYGDVLEGKPKAMFCKGTTAIWKIRALLPRDRDLEALETKFKEMNFNLHADGHWSRDSDLPNPVLDIVPKFGIEVQDNIVVRTGENLYLTYTEVDFNLKDYLETVLRMLGTGLDFNYDPNYISYFGQETK